jgi:type VI secretion system protein ImpL
LTRPESGCSNWRSVCRRPATRWLPLYQLLRDLPHPGGVDATAVPPGHGWGLFQGGRLARSSEQTYHRVLANTLAPALADRLAAELKNADADPARRHQTLKTYLMLVDPQRLDRATVRAWAAQAFALSPDGPVDAAERDEWLRHVDALLERNAFQDAVTVDEAAVQSARKALAAVPLPQRVLALLKREPADAAPRRLDAWLGPLLPLLFDPVGDKAARHAMATLYTRQGLVGRLLPQLDGVVQQLTDEDTWVLGTRQPAGDQARIDAAARNKLLAEVSRLYATEYAEQWQAALGAWHLHRPADADALARLNSQLAAADSPLRQLIGVARNELAFADLPPTPELKVIDAVLAERFGALRAYANGPGLEAIDRALGAVARFTLGPATDSGAAQIAQALRQEAAAAPAPYNAVWSALADSLLAAHRSALRQGLAARLEDVARQCRSVIGDRYPFNATAVQNDVSLADFARLFGPNGIFDAFFRKDLQPHVDTRSRPWRYRDGQGVADETVLRSFERIEDLRRLFFAAGSPLPTLQFALRPIEMDVTLEEFLLDVDGQLLRYENGPSVLRTMTWPGPAASQRVTLRARGLPGEVHEGPWALLRVLSREPWERGDSPGSSRISVAVAGRRLLLDLSLPGQASIAQLAGLASFRCPEVRP